MSVQNLNYTAQSFTALILRPIDIASKKSLRDRRIAEVTYILSFAFLFFNLILPSHVQYNRYTEIYAMHNIVVRESHTYYNFFFLRTSVIERE